MLRRPQELFWLAAIFGLLSFQFEWNQTSSNAVSRGLTVETDFRSRLLCNFGAHVLPAFCDRFALMRILLVLCLVASLVGGASLPTAAPEQAGFSRDRLNQINTVMQEHITAGRLNGASGLIARNGKVIFRETWGTYKPDTIVRMYSMTKAITGVAAMILYRSSRR